MNCRRAVRVYICGVDPWSLCQDWSGSKLFAKVSANDKSLYYSEKIVKLSESG